MYATTFSVIKRRERDRHMAVIVVSVVDVIVSQKRKTNIHCTGLYFDISRIYRSASSNTDILRRISDCWKVTEIMKCRQPHRDWTGLLTSLIIIWKDSLQDRTKCKPSLQCDFLLKYALLFRIALCAFPCLSERLKVDWNENRGHFSHFSPL